MALVLIPVVVGSLLGLIVSVTTNFFTSKFEREEALRKESATHLETLRKERVAHLERAMTLTLKYSNDVGGLLGIGFITKGNITPKDLAIVTAPTDTLQQLNVVISLYFPELKSEFDQILVAHRTMMQRFDEIIDTRDQHRREDAATFTQRIEKEIAPTMERVRSLMKELSECSKDRCPGA